MRSVCLLLPLALAGAFLASDQPSAQAPGVIMQLDRYAHGEFDAVVAELKALTQFDGVLEELRLGGQAWVDAGPEPERARRRLAAATFALEAARAAEYTDWKRVIRLDAWVDEKEGVTAKEGADRVFWNAPPLLVEWGCALLRQDPKPPPIERIWHLASVAVAQGAGDMEFLVGTPFEARMNVPDEITHLWHAQDRFKTEPRLRLAAAIALEMRTWPVRRGVPHVPNHSFVAPRFAELVRDEAVGAEAAVRLGSLHVRTGRLKDALNVLERVEAMTRDTYLIYLARYLKGIGLEKAGQTADAEAAYRGALAAIPHAQSATMALAALLAKQDQRREAGALIETQLSTRPQPLDPWRAYAAGDARFWPELIARLRGEIRP
ncbi:MAG TPA: tetratricopeptide repeat protein [Vicinamibacterales bacterium]|nr:tetratricopeptide repeat protein [Vicinamibacterales bacterium]